MVPNMSTGRGETARYFRNLLYFSYTPEQIAGAEALAAIGQRRHLHELRRARRAAADYELKCHLEAAVDAISERCPPNAKAHRPGSLCLAEDPEQGRLSVTSGAGARLTLAEQACGQDWVHDDSGTPRLDLEPEPSDAWLMLARTWMVLPAPKMCSE